MKHFEKEKEKLKGKQFESSVNERIQVLMDLQNAFYDVVAPIMHDLGIIALELCMDGEVSYTQLVNGTELKCLGFCYDGNTFVMMDANQIEDNVMEKKMNNEELTEEELQKHKELLARKIAGSIMLDDEHTVADFIDENEDLSEHIKNIPAGELKKNIDDFAKTHEFDLSEQFNKAEEIKKLTAYEKRYEQLLEFAKMLSDEDKKTVNFSNQTAEEIAEKTNETIEQTLEKIGWLDLVGGKLFVEEQIFDGKLLNEDELDYHNNYSTMLKGLTDEQREHLMNLVTELQNDILESKDSKNVHKVTLKKGKKSPKKDPEKNN